MNKRDKELWTFALKSLLFLFCIIAVVGGFTFCGHKLEVFFDCQYNDKELSEALEDNRVRDALINGQVYYFCDDDSCREHFMDKELERIFNKRIECNG